MVVLIVSSVCVCFMLRLLVSSIVCMGDVRFSRCSRFDIVLCEWLIDLVVCLCVKLNLLSRCWMLCVFLSGFRFLCWMFLISVIVVVV